MLALLSDPLALIAILTAVCFIATLLTCAYIVRRTKRTDGILHLAELVRALWSRKP
ncbi:hypothetical protein ACFYOT_21880 [Saccharothrix saharensis]|uniref:hypothetical protein n=1 Tax=Saccharothrix saharensis TaxID=571190 RepID=UPI00368E0495